MLTFKRIVSMILALTMICGLLPGITVSAGATENTVPEETVHEHCTDPSCGEHIHETEAIELPEQIPASEPADAVPETRVPDAAPATEAPVPETEAVAAASELDYPALVLNNVSNANIANGGDVAYFQFTPEYAERYVLYAQSGMDTYGTLYNAAGEELAADDDSGSNGDFYLTYDLEAGVTYVFGVKYLDSQTTGVIPVILDVVHNYEYVTVTEPTCTEMGVQNYTCSFCGNVQESYNISAKGHSMENGVCSVCGFTLNYEVIALDMPVDAVIANPGEYVYYQFTPTWTDFYRFESNADFDTYGYLYNTDLEQITCDDDSGNGNNFAINYLLEVGTTYVFGVRCYDAEHTGTIPVVVAASHSCPYTITKEVTCTEDGERIYSCDYCDYSYTEVIPAGHNYQAGICTRCGVSITADMDELLMNTEYDIQVSSENEEVSFYFIPEVTENYNFRITEPDYDYDIYSVSIYDGAMNCIYGYWHNGITCTLTAGETYIVTVQGAPTTSCTFELTIAHSYDEEITTTATCTEPGVISYTCSFCADQYTEYYYLGHNYQTGVCTDCGFDITAGRTELTLDEILNGEILSTEDEGRYYFVPEISHRYGVSLHEHPEEIRLQVTHIESNSRQDIFEPFHDPTHGISFFCYVGDVYLIDVIGGETGTYKIQVTEEHYFRYEDVTPATCTEPGVRKGTCENCDYSYTEEIPAGHNFEDGICTGCGVSVTAGMTELTLDTPVNVTVSSTDEMVYFYFSPEVYDLYQLVLTENNGDWDNYYAVRYNESMEWVGGNYYDSFTASMQPGTTYIIGIAGNPSRSCSIKLVQHHSYNWVDTTPASCTEPGERTYTCAYCDHQYTEEIPAGHDFANGICTRCGTSVTEGKTELVLNTDIGVYLDSQGESGYYYFIPTVTEHYCFRTNNYNYRAWLYDADMDQLNSGSNLWFTLYEGQTYILKITGPEFGNCTAHMEVVHGYYSETTTQPTCTEPGVETFTCQYCGHSYTEVIPARHVLNGTKCVNCDYDILDHAAVMPLGQTVNASILNGGDYAYFLFTPTQTDWYRFYSSANGDTYGYLYDSEMNELARDDDSGGNGNFAIAAELTEGTTYILGVRWYSSERVGNISVSLDISHAYTQTILTERTCTTDGLARYTCGYCGESFEEVIPAGHDWYEGECTVCHADLFEGMPQLVLGQNVSGTLGDMEGYVYYQFTPAVSDYYSFRYRSNQHIGGAIFDSSMNILSRTTNYLWLDCFLEAGRTYVLGVKASTTAALGSFTVVLEQSHEFYSEVIKEPTCTEDGIRILTCAQCGYSYETPIEAGHAWGPGEVIEEPGCETSGSTKYICTRCGEELVETIQPKGHNYTVEVVKAYTCTENGTERYTCTVCGYSYEQTVRAHHTLGQGQITLEPGCTTSGTMEFTCTVCGEKVTEILDPLGHSLVNGVCTVCGYDLLKEAPVLVLDQKVEVPVSGTVETYYQYTPNVTEYYVIESSVGNYMDPYVTLYNVNMGYLERDDDSGNNMNFRLGYTLEAGTTYIFGIRTYNEGNAGTISTTLTVGHLFNSETVTEATCEENGLLRYTCAYCDESFTEVVPASHVYDFVDEKCVVCGEEAVLSGSCGTNLTWHYDYTGGELYISGTGAMKNYSGKAPWAHLYSYIRFVKVQSGVTGIGNNAFRDARNLMVVYLPDTLESIGSNAFTGCNMLDSMYFYGGAPTIADDAFTDLYFRAFYTAAGGWNQSAMKNYGGTVEWMYWVYTVANGEIGNGNWELNNDGNLMIWVDGYMPVYSNPESYPWFAYADQITSASFHGANISNYALKGYKNLNHVYISASVTEIGTEAFAGCENLTNIHFEGDAPVIAADAFAGVTANANYRGGNETWTEEVRGDYGGNLTWRESAYSLASGNLGNGHWSLESTGYLYISGAGEYMPIFDSAEQFPWHAYRDRIESVYMGTINSVSPYAFQDCENLATVRIVSENFESIGAEAFAGCESLRSVYLECAAPEIADDAFEDVEAQVFYPDNDTTWTEAKMQDYGGELYWKSMAVVIAWGAMTNDVEWYLYSNGSLNIHGYSVNGNSSMPVYESAQDYPWYRYADQVTNIYMEIGSVAPHAFEGMKNLEEVQMNQVASIGSDAFSGCGKLGFIYFSGNAPEIAADAFTGVKAQVSYPGNDPSWTSSVKANYGGELTWFEQAYTVDQGNFGEAYWTYSSNGALAVYGSDYSVAEMESVDPEDYPWYKYADEAVFVSVNNVNIGNGAFRKFTALEKVHLYNVEQIALRAFSGCTSLVEITMYGYEIPEIGSTSFYNVKANVYYEPILADWDSSKFQNYGGELNWYFAGQLAAPVLEVTNVASTGKIKLTWSEVPGAAEYKVYRATSKSGTYSLLKTTTGTSLTNTSTTAGKLYYYYVVAVDAEGNVSDPSEVVSRRCDLPRPEITLSNVASTGKIKITWEAIEGAVEYEVYRSLDNETWSKLKTTTGTSLTNTSTTAGKLYYYKVRAIASNSAANSAYSVVESRTCDLARPEITLSNIASSGKIKISWEAVEGAVKYEVYRSLDNKTWSKLSTVTGTSLTNTSTTAGKLYYYKVKAIASKTAANSAYSEVKNRRCDLPRPEITLSNVASSGKIKISWEAIEGAVKYEVYRSKDNKTWSKLSTVTGTSLTNTSTTAGTLYYYKVKAIASNTAANSAYSTVKNRRCDLARPTLSVTLNSKDKPYLSWTKVEDAVKYEVYRSTDNKTWTKLSTTTNTYLTNSSAVSGTKYYYKVRAIASNSAANSAYSTVKSITAG